MTRADVFAELRYRIVKWSVVAALTWFAMLVLIAGDSLIGGRGPFA